MTRIERSDIYIAQFEQRFLQLEHITCREIEPTESLCENSIAGKHGMCDLIIEAYASAGMSGSVDRHQFMVTEIEGGFEMDGAAGNLPQIDPERICHRYAGVGTSNNVQLGFMNICSTSELIDNICKSTDMIDMTMGKQYATQTCTIEIVPDLIDDVLGISTCSSIDQYRLPAFYKVDVGIVRYIRNNPENTHE